MKINCGMFETKVFQHQDLTASLLLDICTIKSTSWPHSLESQKRWISENLSDTDYHLLVYKNGSLAAYMNLVKIKFFLNGERISGLGVGNVCSAQKGIGLGGVVMRAANQFINAQNVSGLLFCKEGLQSFYQKYDWKTIPSQLITFSEFNDHFFETMILNTGADIESLEYADRLF